MLFLSELQQYFQLSLKQYLLKKNFILLYCLLVLYIFLLFTMGESSSASQWYMMFWILLLYKALKMMFKSCYYIAGKITSKPLWIQRFSGSFFNPFSNIEKLIICSVNFLKVQLTTSLPSSSVSTQAFSGFFTVINLKFSQSEDTRLKIIWLSTPSSPN